MTDDGPILRGECYLALDSRRPRRGKRIERRKSRCSSVPEAAEAESQLQVAVTGVRQSVSGSRRGLIRRVGTEERFSYK